MKKIWVYSLVCSFFVVVLSFPSVVNAEQSVVIGESPSELLSRSASGYLYKNGKIISYQQTGRTFVGTINKGTKTWIKGKIEGVIGPAKLSLELGREISTSMKAKRYKATGRVTSRYDKYDRYANKKIGTVTYTNNLTWYEDIAQ
ncbi:hypothetical protein E0L10_02235 [Enterococcus durans]|nr:hypothetical protein [Enterococcus durans]NJE63029.1 hypothetical protein [Enterococcus durans]